MPIPRDATTSRRRASTDMKILGISAHYHDSAAALVVDGVPVCAVQEERLSRRKNDAAFPLERHRMVPGSRRARAGRSRRRRLLRAQHAEVRSDPDLRAAGVPALVAVVSARDQELARRKGLGARHHLVAPRRATRRRSCSPGTTHRTRRPRSSPRRRGARRSSPPTASASGRRSRSATASAAPDGAHRHHAAARDPVSRTRSACCIRRSPRISASR